MLKPLLSRLSTVPGVGAEADDRRADEQADVADAHGEERLERGPAVGLLLPPVPDEHERAEAHDLPAEDQLHHVLGEDHGEHAGGEQREGGEEVGVAAIAAHVLEASRSARACEMNATSSSSMTARPSMCWTDAELEPSARPPHPRVTTGSMNGSASPSVARGIERPNAWTAERCLAARSRSWCAGSTGWRCRRRGPARRASTAMPISVPFIGSFLPKAMMRANATAGMTGISQACSRNQPGAAVRLLLLRTSSALHFRQLVERDDLAVAVDQQHHRQTRRRPRRRRRR